MMQRLDILSYIKSELEMVIGFVSILRYRADGYIEVISM